MLIEIKGITKVYAGTSYALHPLDLNLYSGHSYGLLGKNGAGKSTFINILIDLIKPTSGTVTFDGKTLAEFPEIRSHFGVMSDAVPLVGDFTGLQNLEFTAKLFGLDAREAKNRAESLLRFFFEDEADWRKPVKTYSTGMRRKMSLCCAVLHTPDILLMDEPFAGLDPFAANDMVQFILRYCGKDRLVLTSSHDLDYLDKVVDRILVIDAGNVVSDTSREEFTNNEGQIDTALFRLFSAEEKDYSAIEWLFPS